MKDWLYRKMALSGQVTVGENFHVGPGSRVWSPHGLEIGRDVYIGKWCTIEASGSIGDATMVANNVGVVGRRDHATDEVGRPVRTATWVADRAPVPQDYVSIGTDCWLGYGAVVLTGVTIGDSAIVAAGSVVTRDVPPNAIVAGSPARQLSERFDAAALAEHWALLRERGLRITAE